ncbi:MAG: FAD-dependent oxidoreductase [Halieaceae bacterium]|nr:FAD-dependent oxidoreductase [Halieaceae bacterium]|tara:strand:- start:1342 stop:2466 length:1125 start_codon:yes stop_codon:yes gene_type:complete
MENELLNNTVNTEVLVIGGGAVGAAVARRFALEGAQVVLLERESTIGSGTSSRSSGVIHAGLYYPEGSYKERLCIEGKALLYRYCVDKRVPFEQTGKWIVSSAGQESRLEAIHDQAVKNGVSVRRLSKHEIHSSEPQLRCTAALESPGTGIIDAHYLIHSLVRDFELAGGLVHCRAEAVSVEILGDKSQTVLRDGTHVIADLVINAAGLDALTLVPQDVVHSYKNYYLKGSYFSYVGKIPFKRLIYPLPSDEGLGIHLTLDLSGAARFGPDARPVVEREFSVNRDDLPMFVRAVSEYWPQCDIKKLKPDYAGIRPKLHDGGTVVEDFVFMDQSTGAQSPVISLLGIDSPGLTSALAIAGHVFELSNKNASFTKT